MDFSSSQWLSELENDEDPSFIYQADMNSLDPLSSVQKMTESLQEELDPIATENYDAYYSFNPSGSTEFNSFSNASTSLPFNAPKKKGFEHDVSDGSSSRFLFGNLESLNFSGGDVKPKAEAGTTSLPPVLTWSTDDTIDFQKSSEKSSKGSRLPNCAQEHVMAERKRREKLAQQFIALSALIPGLKKTDKASLLGGAIGYLKQLEGKVKTLEEQATQRTSETTIVVNKSHISADNNKSSNSSDAKSLPLVEANLQGSTILVRIHCEKRKGALVMVLSEIEKLCLSVVNTSVVSFASSSLNITVTAQIEEGFSTTVVDLVKILSSALSQISQKA